MLDQLLSYPWHIHWFSREYVSVSPKEAQERAFLFVTLKPPPIKTVLDESPSCNWMALMPMLLGLGLTLDWLGLWLEISISESVSFCGVASTSAEGFGTHDVAVYLIAFWSQSYDFFKSSWNMRMPVLPGILSSR
jgi:hypothetical protein